MCEGEEKKEIKKEEEEEVRHAWEAFAAISSRCTGQVPPVALASSTDVSFPQLSSLGRTFPCYPSTVIRHPSRR
jgi:hypothetical protein